jgi:hypothetical protein
LRLSDKRENLQIQSDLTRETIETYQRSRFSWATNEENYIRNSGFHNWFDFDKEFVKKDRISKWVHYHKLVV